MRKPEERKQIESTRGKQDDNIKMDANEREWESVNWINVHQSSDKWLAFAEKIIS